MGRLIDADALLSELEKYSDPTAMSRNDYLFGKQQRLETCIELVEDAPTVDAVEVVRCKDCKFYHRMTAETGICKLGCPHLGNDGFCSEGERKGGEAHE